MTTAQTNPAKAGTKTCRHCQASFDIMQEDLDFYTKISPKFGDYVAEIPAPTLCPDCRMRRRLAFRNERNLYQRTCDASKKPIICMYSPDKPIKVYDQKIRWSDAWDPMEYGRDFDFSRTFTEQFDVLVNEVPKPSMYNYFAENSDYCNCTNYQKDCYLTSASSRNERCYYGAYMNDSTSCMDSFMTFNCEQCYMTIDCEDCYGVQYLSNCKQCSNSSFLTNCTNCQDCFGCDGLENASYCFENQQQTREEYVQKIQGIVLADYIYGWKSRKQDETILFSENCTGSHIRYSKNSQACFDVKNIEDSKFCGWFYDSHHCYDMYSRGQGTQFSYECVATGENVHSVGFSTNIDTNSTALWYSMHCRSSSNCFGCVGLNDRQYCIFNKQYTKEEYNELVPKIIEHMKQTGEWGEFFDPSLSPFGYNETVAQEYFPVEKGELDAFGYHRSDYEAPQPQVEKIIPGEKLPSLGCSDIDQKKPDFLTAMPSDVKGVESSSVLFLRK